MSLNSTPRQGPITLRELAKRLGVNPSTVSRVLNRDPNVRISEASRARILDLALATGYRPNRLARSLKLRRTQVIAMLIPDITNPLFSALFREVDNIAGRAGYHVILCNTGDSPRRLEQQLGTLSEGHVDGMLVATALLDDPVIEAFRMRRMPYVLISRRRSDPTDPYVVPDDRAGTRLAVLHLAALGHTRIACVSGSQQASRTAERLGGYRTALAELGLSENIWFAPVGGLDEASGEKALTDLLAGPSENRPTAIFAANDLGAIGVIKAARELGMRVPQDLSVIGCDDLPFSQYVEPPLTTLHYPCSEIGRAGMDLLIRQLSNEPISSQDERQIVLPLELIVRRSTAAPP
jgi:LacI family transcriptional regulator